MLQHPNIVNLEEVLQTEDHVFLVMDLCGGGCLFDALPEDVRLGVVWNFSPLRGDTTLSNLVE